MREAKQDMVGVHQFLQVLSARDQVRTHWIGDKLLDQVRARRFPKMHPWKPHRRQV